jgi:hypothetical protein
MRVKEKKSSAVFNTIYEKDKNSLKVYRLYDFLSESAEEIYNE